ncbi:hypothetical protein [Streptomyces sp. NPDC089919]|uniref:hypothetical protein n=1 Tax=Streptomyces sp. NPDC089919 TaxID=3155188 RepID=UPI00344228E1
MAGPAGDGGRRAALARAGAAGLGVLALALALALDRSWLYAVGAVLMLSSALARPRGGR